MVAIGTVITVLCYWPKSRCCYQLLRGKQAGGKTRQKQQIAEALCTSKEYVSAYNRMKNTSEAVYNHLPTRNLHSGSYIICKPPFSNGALAIRESSRKLWLWFSSRNGCVEVTWNAVLWFSCKSGLPCCLRATLSVRGTLRRCFTGNAYRLR